MGGFEQLALALPTRLAAIGFACALSAAAAGSIAYGLGFRYATSIGAAELATLKSKHAEQALGAESANRQQLMQQVGRANESEFRLFEAMTQHAQEQRQLQERIAHVTTQYRTEPDAVAQPIPRCVFTVGWLRDYNTALGVPSPRSGAVTTDSAQTPGTTPGADTELLESGVTPADILAHAQDYGVWARNLMAQLNALLDLRDKD